MAQLDAMIKMNALEDVNLLQRPIVIVFGRAGQPGAGWK